MDKKHKGLSDELNIILADISKAIAEEREKYEKKNDVWWNALSEQEREDAFYAVVKRIRTAELEERTSYRGALYSVFGFDMGMYSRGMDCGYMDIHNAIFDGAELMEMSQAKELTVVDVANDTTVTWNDVDGISVIADNGVVKLKINGGNPYV